MGLETVVQQLVNGLTIGSFYALVALGYTLVYGIARLINFPHGDLAALGSFVGLTVLKRVTADGLPVLPALAVAVSAAIFVATGTMAAILQVLYRPMFRRKAFLGLMIMALGASMALQNLLQLVFGAAPVAYPNMLPTIGVRLGHIRLTYTQVGLFGASIASMLLLWWFVIHTRFGLAMRALAVDHDAARLMGINVDASVRVVFAMGAALAAISGVMIGLYYTQITCLMGFSLGLKAFTAAVIGGIGNVPGAMLGGFVIGMLETLSAGYVSGRWQDVFVFGALIGTLLLRPTGILGERVADRM